MSVDPLQPVRRRRTYTLEFKAELVAKCLQGEATLASLAVENGMNPNVLHRWVREYARGGRHSLTDLPAVLAETRAQPSYSTHQTLPVPFVPVRVTEGGR